METTDVVKAAPMGAHLGNFLSGMETREKYHDFNFSHFLGNFLSGMETSSLV